MGPDVRSNYYANREQLPVVCVYVFFNIQVGKAIKRGGLQEEGGRRRSPTHVTDRRMECGTCGKPEGRKSKDRRIHREQDKADRSRHDNKHRARGERDEYNRDETGDGPTYMPGGARECGVRYYRQRGPVHGGLNVLGQSRSLSKRERW